MKIDKINLDGKKDSIEVLDKIFSAKINKKLVDSWKELIEQKKWAKLTTSFLENHYDPSYSSNTIKNDRKVIKEIEAMSFNSSEITKIANSIINR